MYFYPEAMFDSTCLENQLGMGRKGNEMTNNQDYAIFLNHTIIYNAICIAVQFLLLFGNISLYYKYTTCFPFSHELYVTYLGNP